MMPHVTIKLNPCTADPCCGLCGRPATPGAGPRLALDDGPAAVCRDCGRKHAPGLVALLDLARVANRVGRIGRHTLVPPFEALLELARAAEVYTTNSVETGRRAA